MKKVLTAIVCLMLNAAAPAAGLPGRIVMMWQVTGPDYRDDFARLAMLGVNTIQSFPLARMDSDYVRGYLDEANRAGLGVVPYLGAFIEGQGSDCRLSSRGTDFIRRYAGHPALSFWHSVDEPADHQIDRQCQLAIYAQIKALDAAHPVMVSINFTRPQQYQQYFAEGAFDLIDLHKYVNPDLGVAQYALLELFRRNKTRDYRTIVTLRAFNSPTRPRREDMQPGSLTAQYDFFMGRRAVGQDVGFYGWRLAPNKGISQIDWLETEFINLMAEKVRKGAE